MSRRYKDEDTPSPIIDESNVHLSIGESSKSGCRRLTFQQIVFSLLLTSSTVVLLMSAYGAWRNNKMLTRLEDYAVDLANVTNKVRFFLTSKGHL